MKVALPMFNELDQYLAGGYNDDLWSDEIVLRAADIVDGLEDADWTYLRSAWKDKLETWQVRLADAVFESKEPCVAVLLFDMLKSPNDHVALTAAQNLETREEVCPFDVSVRQALEGLLSRVDDGDRGAVETVLARALAYVS